MHPAPAPEEELGAAAVDSDHVFVRYVRRVIGRARVQLSDRSRHDGKSKNIQHIQKSRYSTHMYSSACLLDNLGK